MRTPATSLWSVLAAATLSCAVASAAEHPGLAATLDASILADLEREGLSPTPVCSDAVFLRRAFVDVIGTLPTVDEARGFLRDPSPDKRRALIGRLLEREEFTDFWANKWADLLRIKAEYPINLWPNAAQAYHRWIRDAVHADMPYDQFARELLVSNGSNFRVGPVNFFRAVQDRSPTGFADAVALTFMGVRAERWEPRRLEGLAVFFASLTSKGTAEWKEEIVFFDPAKVTAGATGILPDGSEMRLSPDRDPRAVFAAWLTRADNPWFARAAVNRAWSWFFGRGIVHEADDLRPDNPPVNPELLEALERAFVAGDFSFKRLFRTILSTDAYQRSALAGDDRRLAARFGCYAIRQLDAEVLIDAINQITGTGERYVSAIPEPFTYVPPDQRAIGLPDGSISSPFLEMFGRPPRDTGLETERGNVASPTQRLHLLNSTHIRHKLQQGPGIRALLTGESGPREAIDRLFLAILSRPPTAEERQVAMEYVRGSGLSRPEAGLDLAWALINTAEFLHRH